MEMHGEHIDARVRRSIGVFVALLVLTLVTVAVTSFHLRIGYAISAALAIAAVKGSLITRNFMHLSHERRYVWVHVALTVFLVLALVLLVWGSYGDQVRITGTPY